MCNLKQVQNNCILVVDDDAELGHFLVEAIQDEVPAQVLFASSGEQALSFLQPCQPTACLLDYHLPGIDGLELANRLRNRQGCEHLPILLMSADLPQIDISKYHLKTMEKPFDLEKLLQLVTEFLSQ